MRIWAMRLYAMVLALIGLVLAVGGAWLVSLGGSPYYVLAGLGLLASGSLLFMLRREGATLYLAILIATIAWAIWEAGFDGWRLLPRLGGPLVLGLVLLIPPFARCLRGRAYVRGWMLAGAAVVAVMRIPTMPPTYSDLIAPTIPS